MAAGAGCYVYSRQAAGAGDAAKWQKIRHVNGWRPPNEYQIQKSFKYPGAEPLSMTPRTVVLRGFLQPELCDELISSAEPNLVRSRVQSGPLEPLAPEVGV